MADFDPYHEWLGIAPKDQPPNAYRLLALDLFESNAKVIEVAAEQRTMLLRTRANGPQGDITQKLLNEVQRARLLLLDDAKRASYDAELREKLKHSAPMPAPLPRAQALAEPVAETPLAPAGPSVVVPNASRFPQPAPPGNSATLIVAIAVGGVVLFGIAVWWLTRSPEKPPVVVKPPEARPAPSPPRPPIAPRKIDGNPPPIVAQPSVPAPMKEPTPPAVKSVPVEPETPDPNPVAVPTPATPQVAEVLKRGIVPDAKAIGASVLQIRELFKAELTAARTAEQKHDLAKKVMEIAQEEKPGTAGHYAALQLARELAIGSLDTASIATACDALSTVYEIDGIKLRADSLTAALEAPGPAAAKKPLAEAALSSVDDLLAADQFTAAADVIKSLTESARSLKDRDLTQGVAERRKQGTELVAKFREVQPALEVLKTKPEDPAACMTVGRYYCQVKRDFEKGLPLVAKGNDAKWGAVARAELAAPTEADDQLNVADGWYELATEVPNPDKPPLKEHASLWYRNALPGLTGIDKARAEKRIAELPDPESSRAKPASVPVAAPSLPGPKRALAPAPVFPFKVRVLQALWGPDGSKVDVAAKVQKYLVADPWASFRADALVLGDPAFGRAKSLNLTVEIDGKVETINSNESSPQITIPALPAEGVPLANAAKEFRIIAARCTDGMLQVDVTAVLQQRVPHAGLPVHWSGVTWQDPHPGTAKVITVWFDYEGRRYAKHFREGVYGPILDGVEPPATLPFAGTFATAEWREKRSSATFASSERAFGALQSFAGKLDGTGEVRLNVGPDKKLTLGGRSDEELSGTAIIVSSTLRDNFQPQVQEFSWQADSAPVRMVRAADGFCVLSSVSGKLGGEGDAAMVFINPSDGFWYLSGASTSRAISAKALAYRLKPGVRPKLRYVEYFSSAKARSVKMLPPDGGFCYLAGISGNFRGLSDACEVVRGAAGDWTLESTGSLRARAVAVIVEP